MRRTLLSTLAVLALLSSAAFCRAQENKPVAVVSIAPYASIMEDVAFVGKLGDTPGADQQIESSLKMFTKNEGLAGLDKTRPWGVIVTTNGQDFIPLVFLPVADLNKLLGVLDAFVPSEDAGGGVKKLSVSGQSVFAKTVGTWAYFAQTQELLASAPADPLKLLSGLDKKYDVAVRVNVANVPEVYRKFAVDQMKAAAENAPKAENETDEQFEMRQKMLQLQMAQAEQYVNEMDKLTLGLNLDSKTKTAWFDVVLDALPGTAMAKSFSNAKTVQTIFGGFAAPDAAIALNFVSKLEPADIENVASRAQSVREMADKQIDEDEDLDTDEDRAAVKEIVGELFDAIIATAKTGKLDTGAMVKFDDKTLKIAAAATMANPAKVEAAFKKFIKLAEKEENFPKVKYDAVKMGDIRFHTMSVPVPDDQEIKKVVGDKIDVAVGFGKSAIYLTAGDKSMEMLKAALDKTAPNPALASVPAKATISLTPVIKYASAVGDSSESGMHKAVLAELAKASGKDHVIFDSKASDTAMTVRVLVEEGALRLMANATKLQAYANGGLQEEDAHAPADAKAAEAEEEEDEAEADPFEKSK